MISSIPYDQFLGNKALSVPQKGFDITEDQLHPSKKPHQGLIIPWAIKGACRAIFAAFGLGKTHMQLEIARLVHQHEIFDKFRPGAINQFEGKTKFLITCPLGTKHEFKREAKRLGIQITYVRNREELQAAPTGIVLTNYERVRDGDIVADDLIGISLDEASVLRSRSSKTFLEFNREFKQVQYRYVCTATPSPNEYIELLNYADFLGIMDISQAKTRFFKRNSEKADQLTLYAHKEEEFWMWVFSWATFITKPSVLGFSDEGYDLPELDIRYHRVRSPQQKISESGQFTIEPKQVKGLAEAAKEKTASIALRIEQCQKIIEESPEDHYIIWHHLEPERKALEKVMPEMKVVYGSQPEETKEQLLIDFQEGKYPILGTKPEIAGSGNNFQHHCHRAIYLGIDYKFNDFLQALHRIYRYLQGHKVTIDIILTEAEELILKTLLRKWEQHKVLVEKQEQLIKKYGLSSGENKTLSRYLFSNRKVHKGQGDKWTFINNDNVLEAKNIKDDYIKLHFTSIPFATQYEYTPTYNDFGHNKDNQAFFDQMDYIIPEMYRTLEPGRVCLVHVKDRVVFGNYSGLGFPTLDRFSHRTADAFEKHGFHTLGYHTIETDVVRENAQTYRLGWTECCKDATKMGCGVPEYLYVFRKPPSDRSDGYADIRVEKSKEQYSRGRWQIDAHGIWKSSGNRLLTPSEIQTLPLEHLMSWWKAYCGSNIYNYKEHVLITERMDHADKLSPRFMCVAPQSNHPDVWTNIVRMRGLNTKLGQRMVEKHICPLPFDIVERGINLYSNPGELVADFFGGIGTVPYVALEEGRKALAIELNETSWKTGVEFLKTLEYKKSIPTLFDVLHYEDQQACG